jgi:hypothetical protein
MKAPATWYMTNHHEATITPVLVESATDTLVKLAGAPRRQARRSSFDNFHETYAEARDFLVSYYTQELARVDLVAEKARRDLRAAQALPESAP